jgi:secondary thiamine-phosphate synthase enzyme
MKILDLRTSDRNQFVDITSRVNDVVSLSGVSEGIALVYCPHTTAGITINESADPSVVRDILEKLSQLAPKNDGYHHFEGNSDAHIKASLVGSSVTAIIHNSKLVLGTWQGIFFCEFDGPRSRKFMVKIIES